VIAATFALILVVALIIGLAWLLRRLPGMGSNTGDGIRMITGISLGNKERAMVIEVNGQQLLLGVTSGAVSLLYTLETPLPEKSPVRLAEFASLLKRRR